MKSIRAVLLFLILVISSISIAQINFQKLSLDAAKAKTEHKYVFIDFRAD